MLLLRNLRSLLLLLLVSSPLSGQDTPEPVPYDFPGPRGLNTLIAAGAESGLPQVQPNDNRTAAGQVVDGVREISLEVMRADFRVEGPQGPGLRVAAIGESGSLPVVPAPLIRVEEGTRVRVSVHNRLDDVLQVFGLHDRPADAPAPFEIGPGEARTVEFLAGAQGTYMYYMFEGGDVDPTDGRRDLGGEREQLAGAIVVDPVGGPTMTDRIMVINIFGEPWTDGEEEGFLEGLTINGLSWPYTELLELEVGRTERWKVVNASNRGHPMHLHGFYFDVLSRGTVEQDTVYSERDRRMVVTETMGRRTTMDIEWTPTRPGRWLFHCHLSFHVSNEIRLPGAAEADPEHTHSHMAVLVMGLDIAPGPTDLIARGTPLEIDLHALKYGEEKGLRYGFSFDPNATGANDTDAPGPVLVLHQYQPADVTVHNQLGVPTGVHWHGLELDSWADGVPGWSSSDGKMSPAIEDGESFTYRLSTLRPGTFIYHSHLDDIDQLTGGLYGALVVLPEGEVFDPRFDHLMIQGWRTPQPSGPEDFELNGRREQPDMHAIVGETHRFRVIDIAPAGVVRAWMLKDGEPIPIRLHAKDGADLPPHQQVEVLQLPMMDVGETADFLWLPTEPGVYELVIGPNLTIGSRQRWIVTERQPGGH